MDWIRFSVLLVVHGSVLPHVYHPHLVSLVLHGSDRDLRTYREHDIQ